MRTVSLLLFLAGFGRALGQHSLPLDSVLALQKATWECLFQNQQQAESLMQVIESPLEQLPDSLRAITANHRGILCDLRGQSAEAALHFEQAVALFNAQPDRQAAIRRNLAMTLRDLNRFDEAIGELEAALAHWKLAGNASEQARVHCAIGMTHFETGAYDLAAEGLYTGIALFDPTTPGDALSMAIEENNLARLVSIGGDGVQAEELFARSARRLAEHGRPRQALTAGLNAAQEAAEQRNLTALNDHLEWLNETDLKSRSDGEGLHVRWRSLLAIQSHLNGNGLVEFDAVWDESEKDFPGNHFFISEWMDALLLAGDTAKALEILQEARRLDKNLDDEINHSLRTISLMEMRCSGGLVGKHLMEWVEEAEKRFQVGLDVRNARFRVNRLAGERDLALSEAAHLAMMRQEEGKRARAERFALGFLVIAFLSVAAIFRLRWKGVKARADVAQIKFQEELKMQHRTLAARLMDLVSVYKQVEAHAEQLAEHRVNKELIQPLLAMNRHAYFKVQFSNEFAKLHPDFDQNLLRLAPQISPNEIELAKCLKIGLSMDEISQVLNLTRPAALTRKYRLRKSLGISGNDPILPHLPD